MPNQPPSGPASAGQNASEPPQGSADQPPQRSTLVRAVLHPTRMPVYLLLAAVLLGLFLQMFASDVHERIFIGGLDEAAELEAFDGKADATRERLQETGVSAAAIAEREEQAAQQRQRYIDALDHAHGDRDARLKFHLMVFMGAALVLATVEVIASRFGPWPQSLARLGSYVALACGVLIVAARPELFGLSNRILIVGLIVLVVIAGLGTAIKRRSDAQNPEIS